MALSTMTRSKKSTELPVDVFFLFTACDSLIKGEVNLVGLVDLALLNFGHGRTEGFEVVGHGLIDQDIAVGKKKDALFALAFHSRQMIERP